MADNSIESAVERYLSALPESDWQALCARVRPPGADWREFFAEHELVDTEPDEPQNLIVPKEGLTPHPGPISDEQYNRDFVRRVFDDEYDAYQPPLPE